MADAGSVVEVRGTKDEELEVHVDGALTERVAAGKDLSTATPPLSFRVDGITAHETFTASAEALDALADSSATKEGRRRGITPPSFSPTG